MNKYIVFSALLFLTACGTEPNTNKVQPCEDDSVTVVDEASEIVVSGDSATFTCDIDFCRELKKNMEQTTEEQRIQQLANNQFWAADTLTSQQYAVLFNYLLDHQENKYDDQIGDFIFEYFQTNVRFRDFDHYYDQYPNPNILEALTFSIVSSWKNENESITEKAFKTKFGYLYSKCCIKYLMMLESLEK